MKNILKPSPLSPAKSISVPRTSLFSLQKFSSIFFALSTSYCISTNFSILDFLKMPRLDGWVPCRSGRSGNIGGFGFSGQIEKLDEPNNSQIGDRGRNDLVQKASQFGSKSLKISESPAKSGDLSNREIFGSDWPNREIFEWKRQYLARFD